VWQGNWIVENTQNLKAVWCTGYNRVLMDYLELQEIRRILKNHEETIQCNMTSIFSITTKVHENEHWVIYEIATIMGTLVQQKHQIVVLEAVCNMLRNMVLNLPVGGF
jgi:hypothetical protein